jgi:thiamine biosynthesis lipoprotein ApbE
VFCIIYIVCTSTTLSVTHSNYAQCDNISTSLTVLASTPLSLTVVVTFGLVTLSGVICHPERSRRVFCIIYIVCTSTTLSVTHSNYAQCDNISTSLTVLASTPLSLTVVVTPSLVMLSPERSRSTRLREIEGCSVLFILFALRLRSV